MGAPKHEKGGQAEYTRALRKNAVKNGRCGYCGAIRNRYKWLCDACAEDHREKQRLKAWEKRQNELLGVVATWTAPFPIKRGQVMPKEQTLSIRKMLIRLWWSERTNMYRDKTRSRAEFDRITDRCVAFGVMEPGKPVPTEGAEDLAAEFEAVRAASIFGDALP